MVGEVLGGRIVESPQVASLIFRVGWVVPNLHDAIAHHVGQHLGLVQLVDDVAALVLRDVTLTQKLEALGCISEAGLGLADGRVNETKLYIAGVLASHAKLIFHCGHAVEANQAEHTESNRCPKGTVKGVLKGEAHPKLVAKASVFAP